MRHTIFVLLGMGLLALLPLNQSYAAQSTSYSTTTSITCSLVSPDHIGRVNVHFYAGDNLGSLTLDCTNPAAPTTQNFISNKKPNFWAALIVIYDCISCSPPVFTDWTETEHKFPYTETFTDADGDSITLRIDDPQRL